ncbi:hypothetical protein ACI2UK_27035 [Ralstonia nicotianae]|uniref:hypothetical protein n=1 Tax=Ralstonia pseudosolanacearum TaxID=1310165 RepID=UPI002004DEE9|nr:hypothetical protein [Ralstonia pseudosolanacearum]MCK4120397.1 hypothetical protein [Ralstonia pseudosolanacearum]
MDIPLISQLVGKQGFELMCWDDRYAKGVWAVCLPGFYQAQAVRDSSEDGDLDMTPATEYLLDSSWLPVVTGANLGNALTKLEARLAALEPSQLERHSDWRVATYEALSHLMEVRRESTGYGHTDGKFRALPKDFAVIARAVDRSRTKDGGVTW